jgi:hypothetical protein
MLAVLVWQVNSTSVCGGIVLHAVWVFMFVIDNEE